MSGNYILDGQTPVPCDDIMEWGRWFEQRDVRRVGYDTVGVYSVSTVFLGIDHAFGSGAPLLFETMVFPNGDDTDDWGTERYTTWEQAATGHQAMIERCERRIVC